ncbi:metal ABC transporter solute-binding protein, Zn/Mn family [Anabaena sp. FACHB-1237]|uniref:metal ABC transporter solute-binding protein, Zn/Mn family n=1 Tax=Anabaena sp. FACHB-1237 TaxID=2692769 RepID=UPI001F55A9FB|nr:zinc ABC transporter substrate-binding protein [Anabaena sp. FACHB-1237]
MFLLSFVYSCNGTNNQKIVSETTAPVTEKKTQIATTKVVTTFLPVYLFTKAVVKDIADIEILVKPGTDVHEYQGTPDNVKAIATANVLVKNGLGLEEFLENTIKNSENAKLLTIDASKGIKPINAISPVDNISKGDDEHDHNHNHKNGNPHVWLDPVLAKQQVLNIRDGLIVADPQNKSKYESNAAAYIQKLDNLNNQFQETLKKTPNCTFITFHDAFPYLAKRYNLKQVAVITIPERQLSPTDIQKVIKTVKKYQVNALFSEPGINNKLLESIAKDLKLTVHTLDSLENGETNPDYYFKVMQKNLKTLADNCQ